MSGVGEVKPTAVIEFTTAMKCLLELDYNHKYKLSHKRTKRDRELWARGEACVITCLCSYGRALWRKFPSTSMSTKVQRMKDIFRKSSPRPKVPPQLPPHVEGVPSDNGNANVWITPDRFDATEVPDSPFDSNDSQAAGSSVYLPYVECTFDEILAVSDDESTDSEVAGDVHEGDPEPEPSTAKHGDTHESDPDSDDEASEELAGGSVAAACPSGCAVSDGENDKGVAGEVRESDTAPSEAMPEIDNGEASEEQAGRSVVATLEVSEEGVAGDDRASDTDPSMAMPKTDSVEDPHQCVDNSDDSDGDAADDMGPCELVDVVDLAIDDSATSDVFDDDSGGDDVAESLTQPELEADVSLSWNTSDYAERFPDSQPLEPPPKVQKRRLPSTFTQSGAGADASESKRRLVEDAEGPKPAHPESSDSEDDQAADVKRLRPPVKPRFLDTVLAAHCGRTISAVPWCRATEVESRKACHNSRHRGRIITRAIEVGS